MKLVSITLLASILLLHTVSLSKSNQSNWYEGIAVLNNQKVVSGDMKLNQEFNVLQVKNDGQILSIPAYKIEKVTILDQGLEVLRSFVSIPIKEKDAKIYQFYEVIVNGEVQLLGREKQYTIATEEVLADIFNKITPAQNKTIHDQDYFFYDGKNLIQFSRFRKQVLPAFKKYFGDEIAAHIKNEKLNINLPKDQVQIVKYFNKLYNDKLIFAREQN